MASSHGSGGAAPLERFTLLEKIGRGGMGVVWKGRDDENGQIVAIKLLHAAYADQPDYVARFERELELAQRIHSNNVVEVLGYGVRDGTPYLALQYIDGPSLRQLINEHGPYTWDETRALLIQITTGLKDAHAAGVVHRDVKPSNVLVGSDGVARLADFGIARGIDLTRVTGTSTLLGTPAYLAPEGAKDERADLYSLGVVAYELLAGVPPFDGESFSDVLLAHLRSQPDMEKLPEAARPIVSWLMAKDPNVRPQTAAELLEALQGKKKAPLLAPAAAGAFAGAEAFTHPLGWGAQAPVGKREQTRRGRRVRVALLLSALVIALAAGATWGSQSGFGHGPNPTGSSLVAAGGVGSPLSAGQNDSSETALPSGSSADSISSIGVTPGAPTAPPTPRPVTVPPDAVQPQTPPPDAVQPQTPPPAVQTTPPPAVQTTPPPAAPTAPSNLTVSPVSGSAIRLTWNDNSNNETGFELDNGSSDLGSVPANTTTWTMTGLASGQYVCFHLYAFNAAGHSAWTSYACTTTLAPPAAPSNIQAQAQGKTSIWVGWSDNSSNETSFEISDGTNTISLAAGTTSYTWSVSAGTYKCSEVRAVNSIGSSSWVGWACTTSAQNVYCSSSTNVTVYSGTNYTGSSVNLNFGDGDVNNVTNLPWTPRSFTDPNNASHIVMHAGQNGSGNPTHYDSAQSDISNISGQSATGWSVTAYVKSC